MRAILLVALQTARVTASTSLSLSLSSRDAVLSASASVHFPVFPPSLLGVDIDLIFPAPSHPDYAALPALRVALLLPPPPPSPGAARAARAAAPPPAAIAAACAVIAAVFPALSSIHPCDAREAPPFPWEPSLGAAAALSVGLLFNRDGSLGPTNTSAPPALTWGAGLVATPFSVVAATAADMPAAAAHGFFFCAPSCTATDGGTALDSSNSSRATGALDLAVAAAAAAAFSPFINASLWRLAALHISIAAAPGADGGVMLAWTETATRIDAPAERAAHETATRIDAPAVFASLELATRTDARAELAPLDASAPFDSPAPLPANAVIFHFTATGCTTRGALPPAALSAALAAAALCTLHSSTSPPSLIAALIAPSLAASPATTCVSVAGAGAARAATFRAVAPLPPPLPANAHCAAALAISLPRGAFADADELALHARVVAPADFAWSAAPLTLVIVSPADIEASSARGAESLLLAVVPIMHVPHPHAPAFDAQHLLAPASDATSTLSSATATLDAAGALSVVITVPIHTRYAPPGCAAAPANSTPPPARWAAAVAAAYPNGVPSVSGAELRLPPAPDGPPPHLGGCYAPLFFAPPTLHVACAAPDGTWGAWARLAGGAPQSFVHDISPALDTSPAHDPVPTLDPFSTARCPAAPPALVPAGDADAAPHAVRAARAVLGIGTLTLAAVTAHAVLAARSLVRK